MTTPPPPTPARPTGVLARLRATPGWSTVILASAALILAIVAGCGTLLVAVERAEVQFDRLLEDKALSRALRVQRDLQLAANLGIPLGDIRGMYDYAEAIPSQDPDIRFIAVTDLNLKRLHYGGIGRRRLDPLLANPQLKAKAAALLTGAVALGGAVNVGEFAITTLPIRTSDGTPVGYVHVAVQARQLRERFTHEFIKLLPVVALALILTIELAAFAYGAGYRDPMRRLERLLKAAAEHSSRAVLSGRHAGGELGASMFRFNAVMYRLTRRTNRLLGYADEVRGAVFEPAAVRQIDAIERATREEAAELTTDDLAREIDARTSDFRLQFLAAMTGIFLALSWPLMKGDLVQVPFAALAALVAMVIGARFAPPAATFIVVVIALLISPALDGWRHGTSWSAIGLASGALVGLAVYYWRKTALVPRPLWFIKRIASAAAIAALMVVTGDALLVPAYLTSIAVLATALAVPLRAPVRTLLFKRTPPRVSINGSG